MTAARNFSYKLLEISAGYFFAALLLLLYEPKKRYCLKETSTPLDWAHHCAAGVSPRACSRETPPPLDAPAPRDLLEAAGAGACWFLICSSVSRRSATVAKEALAGREWQLPTDVLSKKGMGGGGVEEEEL